MNKELPGIHAKYPETVCYVCGRNKKDLKKINDHITDAFENAIDRIEGQYKALAHEYKSVYQKVVDETEGVNLDVSIKTVNADRVGYSERIPHLTAMLEYFYRHMARRSANERSIVNENVKLSEVRARLMNIELNELRSLQDKLRYYKDSKKKFQELEEREYQFHEVTTTLSALLPNLFYENPEIKVKREIYREHGEPYSEDRRAELGTLIAERVAWYKDLERLKLGSLQYTVYICDVCSHVIRDLKFSAHGRSPAQHENAVSPGQKDTGDAEE